MTYKRAVSAEPREPASRAKKAKKQQQFGFTAPDFKFQVKQSLLGEMRANWMRRRISKKGSAAR